MIEVHTIKVTGQERRTLNLQRVYTGGSVSLGILSLSPALCRQSVQNFLEKRRPRQEDAVAPLKDYLASS